ncbi:hypothetical protein EHW97_11475 [Aeromicrobium camelliae]|uniref:Uncharacterized protein n=1 Tax=Aeromicrobium camelliae TaxID=1538144 RepID=A0A3N6WMM3_9ACTN|nr:hypothetical protein [Aeromicrobium camelliae]RQN03045.1 hypothetical protein EHW97_11475 [Aeromicrobium camelliae]
MDFSYLPSVMIAAEEIDPEGNQSIGWLAGGFTLLLFIVVALLLWSFARMARRAREPWQGEDEQDTSSPETPGDDDTTP